MKVTLISKTQGVDGLTAEQLVAYTARVSNPNNQANHETGPKLVKYLIKHKHWSPLDMADLTFEIETSRAIAAQILRHKSLFFQEFSQRYQSLSSEDIEIYPARRQDLKNKQNSIDDMDEDTRIWFKHAQEDVARLAFTLYEAAIKKGVAKEQARMLLPLNTKTRLYAKGSLRSWIHYCEVRADASTQKEHRDIALAIREILIKEAPSVAEACGWIDNQESK
jgi:thymidylate synthase (FAD)